MTNKSVNFYINAGRGMGGSSQETDCLDKANCPLDYVKSYLKGLDLLFGIFKQFLLVG